MIHKSKRQDTKTEIKERHHALKGKYMKVCRENARLRRELDKWLACVPEDVIITKRGSKPQCPKCGHTVNVLILGIHTLKICNNCNWRKRETNVPNDTK